MMVVVLVMIVVTEMSLSARVDLEGVTNEVNTFQLDSAVQSAFSVARILLKHDGGENQHDGPQDKWADPERFVQLDFGDARIKIDVIDESRKYNIYWVTAGLERDKRRAEERLIAIIDGMREETAHDITPGEAQDLASKITHYVKVRRAGKKSEFEDNIILPPTREHVMLSLRELTPLVGEFILFDQETEDGEKLPGLERFITIWSDGTTNVNTAELNTLACYFPQNERHKAEAIIEARETIASEAEENKESKASAPAPAVGLPGGLGGGQGAGQGGGLAGALGGGGAGGKGKFVGVDSLDALVKADAISNKDKEALTPFLGTKSDVFSVFITAKLKKSFRRVRMVVRRDGSTLYTLLRETRTDPRVVFGDEEDPFAFDEDDEGRAPAEFLRPR